MFCGRSVADQDVKEVEAEADADAGADAEIEEEDGVEEGDGEREKAPWIFTIIDVGSGIQLL